MNTIPNSPNDMPPEWARDPRNIQQAMRLLEEFEFVEICYYQGEADDRGNWGIEIEGRDRLRVKSRHPQFANALWFAVLMADNAAQKAVEARKAARDAALAKLTPEDRKALGLA